MKQRSQGRVYRQPSWCGCLLVGLMLGACSGDDDSTESAAGGSSGFPSLGGALSSGASAGEPSSSAGETSTSAGESATTSGAAGLGEEPAPGGAGGGSAAGGSAVGGGVNGGGGAGNGLYLPCASLADCKMYGGGKVCCADAGMQFCTKQSACSGNTLP
jgi:hypothetical protein